MQAPPTRFSFVSVCGGSFAIGGALCLLLLIGCGDRNADDNSVDAPAKTSPAPANPAPQKTPAVSTPAMKNKPAENTEREPEVTSHVQIEVRIQQSQEFRIYQDRIVWTPGTGRSPATVKVNDISWLTAKQKTLPNRGNTRYLPDNVSFLNAKCEKTHARGKVVVRKHSDHVYLRITDPQPKAGRYVLKFDFPEQRQAKPVAVTNRVRVKARIDGMQDIRIYRDAIVWTSRRGPSPRTVTVNNLEWNPTASPRLPNEGKTRYLLRDVSFQNADVSQERVRGKVTIRRFVDHVYIHVVDPMPGADLYVLDFQFKKLPAGPYALRFEKQGRVELADTRDLLDLNGAFTVEMWVRPEENATLAGDELWPMMNPQAPAVTGPSGWLLQNRPNGLEFTIGVAGGSYLRMTSHKPLDRTRWHHVAVSKSPTSISLYLDGQLVGLTEVAGRKFVASSTPLYLGVCKFAHQQRRFAGDVKAFRISKSARYAGSHIDPPAEFPVDDQTLCALDFGSSRGSGATIVDRSSRKHHGTITGARWIHQSEIEATAASPAAGTSPVNATVEEFADLRISGTFDHIDTAYIYKDKAIWRKQSAKWPWPKNLKFNGVAWSPALNNTLANRPPTRFLPENVSMNDVVLTTHAGRGKVVFKKTGIRTTVTISDPQPGGGFYDFTLRYKVQR